MNEEFRNRVKFWEISDKKVTTEEILDFEKCNGILLPNEYKQLLVEYGKLSHTKTWYWFYEDDGVSDHLISHTLNLTDQHYAKKYFWDEMIEHNPNINADTYLPVISTPYK